MPMPELAPVPVAYEHSVGACNACPSCEGDYAGAGLATAQKRTPPMAPRQRQWPTHPYAASAWSSRCCLSTIYLGISLRSMLRTRAFHASPRYESGLNSETIGTSCPIQATKVCGARHPPVPPWGAWPPYWSLRDPHLQDVHFSCSPERQVLGGKTHNALLLLIQFARVKCCACHSRLQDVHFSYNPEREVLKGVNVTAEPGQSVAIVGPSGSGGHSLCSVTFPALTFSRSNCCPLASHERRRWHTSEPYLGTACASVSGSLASNRNTCSILCVGKSTLLRLMVRLYDVSTGGISLNGVDVRCGLTLPRSAVSHHSNACSARNGSVLLSRSELVHAAALAGPSVPLTLLTGCRCLLTGS